MLIKHTHLPSRIILYTLVKQSQLALTHSSCNVIITCREKYQQFLHSHFVTLCLSFDWKNTNYDGDVRYRLIGYEFFLLFISFFSVFSMFQLLCLLNEVECAVCLLRTIWFGIVTDDIKKSNELLAIVHPKLHPYLFDMYTTTISLSFQGQWWHAIAT